MIPVGITRICNDARATKTRFYVLHSVKHCTSAMAWSKPAKRPPCFTASASRYRRVIWLCPWTRRKLASVAEQRELDAEDRDREADVVGQRQHAVHRPWRRVGRGQRRELRRIAGHADAPQQQPGAEDQIAGVQQPRREQTAQAARPQLPGGGARAVHAPRPQAAADAARRADGEHGEGRPRPRRAGQPSAVFHAVRHLRKPMNLSSWLGANRSDTRRYHEDLQRRQGGKDAVLCAA